MKNLTSQFLHFLPLIFGLGFLAPLTAEILRSFNISPFGMPPLAFGLLLGAIWGAWATWRRSWL